MTGTADTALTGATTPSHHAGRRTTWKLDAWKVVYIVILVLAVTTRLVALGDRAVSHDETTHAKYSWNLYTGRGFRHDPLMHGPALFEATALAYALFGVSDFTARLYTALTGVVLVMAPWLFRKWLGRLGAVLASIGLLISPSITYYSRYTRHDLPVLLAAFLLLWAILRYLDEGETRWLWAMGAFYAWMYASKENAYIYTAIYFILMTPALLWQMVRLARMEPPDPPQGFRILRRLTRPQLQLVLALTLVIGLGAGGLFLASMREAELVQQGATAAEIGTITPPAWGRLALGLAILALVAAGMVATVVVGEGRLRRLRLFDVLIVLGTFTLPLGSALLMKFVAGVDMRAFYQAMMSGSFSGAPLSSVVGAFVTLGLTLAAGVLIGLWWDVRRWPIVAAVYYAIFLVLYTTFFTQGWGALTGLVGGLAYWIAQHGEQRGSQPWYYYGIIGSLYDFMPILISLVGGAWLTLRTLAGRPVDASEPSDPETCADVPRLSVWVPRLLPFFLLGWAGLSWVAYSVAGEKMPWLFVHIAFPHILLAAWTLDRVFRRLTWSQLTADRAWLVPTSWLFLGLAWAAFQASSDSLGRVFQPGSAEGGWALALAQLEPLGRALGGLTGILIFGGLLVWAVERLGLRRSLRLSLLTPLLFLGAVTVRTMVRACYIDDELATEYIVYAHATPDVNQVLDELDALSWRLTGTPDQLRVAYSQHVAWPLYWYMDVRYPGNYYFETPDPERLLDSPVIIAAREEWPAVEAIIGDRYHVTDYKHIWWPIEDYKDLTWERVRTVLTEPERRRALWDIVWDRDYTAYARLRNPGDPFTLKTWPHRSEFRFYVRKDIGSLMWDVRLEAGQLVADGGAPGPGVGLDPFAELESSVSARSVIDLSGTSLRGLAIAPDDSLYLVDSSGHRVWHVGTGGELLGVLGGHGTGPGELNTPWDVAVDDVGHVYVADTWNHRVRVFDQAGEPVAGWGRLAQIAVDDPTGYGAFFGPRGMALGPDGHVVVADTGNHRIQIFDAAGQFVRAFGGGGDLPGQLSEPVGVAVAASGEIYVADTWHRRVQVFSPEGIYLREWPVSSWGQADAGRAATEDLRAQIAIRGESVVVTDPGYGRLLHFDTDGVLQRVVRPSLEGAPGQPEDLRPAAVALTVDEVIVTDSANGLVFGYPLDAGR